MVKEIVTPDGGKRMILEYKLDEYISATKLTAHGLELDAHV